MLVVDGLHSEVRTHFASELFDAFLSVKFESVRDKFLSCSSNIDALHEVRSFLDDGVQDYFDHKRPDLPLHIVGSDYSSPHSLEYRYSVYQRSDIYSAESLPHSEFQTVGIDQPLVHESLENLLLSFSEMEKQALLLLGTELR